MPKVWVKVLLPYPGAAVVWHGPFLGSDAAWVWANTNLSSRELNHYWLDTEGPEGSIKEVADAVAKG